LIILWACLVLLAVNVVLPGSRLSRLGRKRWRHAWLVWLALAVQVVVISVLPDVRGLSEAAHLSTYALAAAFVAVNHRSVGTLVIGIGGLLNLVAITANGGVMPATRDALEASGWEPTPGHFANSALVADPHVQLLGDWFATPSWLPLHSVFSVGDMVIVAGFALFLHETCWVGRAARLPGHATTESSSPAS
jgi:Family of unknown function (DUF5317)